MRISAPKFFPLWLGTIVAGTILLASCGGGGPVSGAGGSGVGGTGIFARVQGNVGTVTAKTPYLERNSVIRVALAFQNVLIPTAIAQIGDVSGIQVAGGGQNTTTDQFGNFTLDNVNPSGTFVLTLTLRSSQNITLGIGNVPPGSTVVVSNIAINTTQSSATPQDITVTENQGGNGNNNDDNGNDNDDNGNDNDDNGNDNDDNGNNNDDNGNNNDDNGNDNDDNGNDNDS